MQKILGIGNALVDVLIKISESELQKQGLTKGAMTLIDAQQMKILEESLMNAESQVATGGSAANSMLALALLGDRPGFVGTIGNDSWGQYLQESAAKRDIKAHFNIVKEAGTGVATTFITPDGERTFATHLGAALLMEPEHLTDEMFRGYGILHIEGYLVQNHALMEHIVKTAKRLGLTISYDLASFNVVLSDHEFITDIVRNYVDILFANQEEAAAFSGSDDPEKALEIMSGMTQVAIEKLGKDGATATRSVPDASGKTMTVAERATAPLCSKEKPVDTTAAGDFFAAGFLHGWSQGLPLGTCLNYGNLIAGEVIKVIGTNVTSAALRSAIANSKI
ncbi:MAG: adenosine kinase [Bacteroidaceae bacterium]|nr:adenosine kinase [Bacteroidaceae bacterium]